MIVYFANRNAEILGQASTRLPQGLVIIDDQTTEEINSGVSSLSLVISFKDSERLNLEQMTAEGNYVFRTDGGEAELFQIITATTKTKAHERQIECEDAGLDLLNEIAPAYASETAQTAEAYDNRFLGDSGFTVGVNEISHLTRKLAWTGNSTVTERLRSIANSFDGAEISYSFVIDRLKVTAMHVNLWKKRGADAGVQLRLDRDINDILVTGSIENLVTAVRATGGTPEGSNDPITLNGYTYDDGDNFVQNGVLYSRSASRKWARLGADSTYIVGSFTYDTTSQSELFNRALSYLDQYKEPSVNYEVDIARGLDNCHIGDRVHIVDDAGEVYVSARLLVIKTSETRGEKIATLGEYLIEDSGISARVAELASQFQDLANRRQFYTWIAYADDDQGTGISLDPTGKSYLGTATSQLEATPDLTDPSVFTWVALGDATDYFDLSISSSAGTVFIDTLITTTLIATVILNEVALTASDLATMGLAVNWYDVTTGTLLSTGLTYAIVNATSVNVTAKLEEVSE